MTNKIIKLKNSTQKCRKNIVALTVLTKDKYREATINI